MTVNAALVRGIGHARVGGFTPNGTFYGPMALSGVGGGGGSPQAVTPLTGSVIITGYAPTVAQSSAVTFNLVLDFEDVALDAAVSNQYASSGLTFGSGNIVKANQADPGGTVFFPASTSARSGPHFVMNAAVGSVFSITFAAGYRLNTLTLDAAANTSGLTINVIDVASGSTVGFQISAGSDFSWQQNSAVSLPSLAVSRLDFVTDSGGRFAIDHLLLNITH